MNTQTAQLEATTEPTATGITKNRGGRPKKPPPPPKPPKEPREKFDYKAYHKNYYREKLKLNTQCEFYGTCLGSVQAVAKHNKKNRDCQIIKLKKIINDNNLV